MNARLPLYAQLKASLIGTIGRGEHAPGDQIPSQRLLCERYGMSHMTVRRALNELLSEGVIYGIPGKGLYVADRKQDAEAGPLIGFSQDMAHRGMRASSQMLAAGIVAASTALASVLGVTVGAPLVHLRRLRLADDQPMALQTTYLPHALVPGLLDHDLAQHSLFEFLRGEYGLCLARGTTAVEAGLATDEQAALLELPPPAPLLIVEQLTFLDDGQAIEFVRTAYRGDRYRLRVP